MTRPAKLPTYDREADGPDVFGWILSAAEAQRDLRRIVVVGAKNVYAGHILESIRSTSSDSIPTKPEQTQQQRG